MITIELGIAASSNARQPPNAAEESERLSIICRHARAQSQPLRKLLYFRRDAVVDASKLFNALVVLILTSIHYANSTGKAASGVDANTTMPNIWHLVYSREFLTIIASIFLKSRAINFISLR